jgi:hypothetical protein
MSKRDVVRGAAAVALALGLIGARTPARADGDRGAAFRAAASAAFTEADADGSGELSAAEFVNFHEILRAKLEALRFAKLDTDGSGGVSQAELAAGRPHGRGRGCDGEDK